MTITYPHDRPLPNDGVSDAPHEEPFIPVYARTRSARGKGGVKTWMILAPIGVLLLGGSALALVMAGGDDSSAAPLVEPAATGPVLSTQPLVNEIAPLETPAGTTIEVAPEPAARAAPAPAPVRRAAPAPARHSTPAPAPATREAPAEPAGPQPYTSSLNSTPPATAPVTPAPPPAPPPVIVIQPQA